MAPVVALCLGLFSLSSCATLDEVASPDLGDLGPSEAGIRQLLEEDRVRQALPDARELARRYGGARSQVLLGWAQWRNGDLAAAERSFRSPAEGGLPDAEAGLAHVLAARLEWQRAVELAESAAGSESSESAALAVLASAAWWQGDAAAAAAALRAWSRTQAAAAVRGALQGMAGAVGDLAGPPNSIRGEADTVELDEGGGLRVGVADRSLRFRFDPAVGQTRLSPEVAAALGLSVHGGRPEAEATAATMPLFALRQAACPEIRIGDTVVRHLVVGVGPAPEGFDGVLGGDLLVRLRWSLRPDTRLLAVGPPEVGRRVETLVAGRGTEVLAWMGARVVVRALGVQLLFYPRVGGRALPAVLDLRRPSALDLADATSAREEEPRAPGEAGVGPPPLTLAGRRWEVAWEERSLESWAAGGGLAPQVSLGPELFEDRVLHWVPETAQLRLEQAAEGASTTARR